MSGGKPSYTASADIDESRALVVTIEKKP